MITECYKLEIYVPETHAEAVKKAIFDESIKKPLYILGLIVHNKKIKEALEHYGVISFAEPKMTRLEMVEQINDGTVVLSAHGTSPLVKKRLKEKICNLDKSLMKEVDKSIKVSFGL